MKQVNQHNILQNYCKLNKILRILPVNLWFIYDIARNFMVREKKEDYYFTIISYNFWIFYK